MLKSLVTKVVGTRFQRELKRIQPLVDAIHRHEERPKVVVTGHEITWDMVPYDVQLIGGVVLHQGKIAEMATGEGKTLVATLPLYLNALARRGAHLVTVNNYLARRDSQWMGHVFKWLGLTVGCIDDTTPSSPERSEEHTSELQSPCNLVCRLLLEKKKHEIREGASHPCLYPQCAAV